MKTNKQCKKVLLDASSGILLVRAGVYEIVAERYDNLMSESVYDEITGNSLPGSNEYVELLEKHRLKLVPVKNVPRWCLDDESLQKLDKGERDTITLFASGNGDFIITDDGRAARYCLEKNLPFVNSLLMLRILNQSCLLKKDSYEVGFKTLVRLGWYSEKVIEYVHTCPDSELLFFFP